MSAGPSLNHLVDQWKSIHSTLSSVVSRPTPGDCFRDICASLPNVSSWPVTASDPRPPNGCSRPRPCKNGCKYGELNEDGTPDRGELALALFVTWGALTASY